MRRNNREPSHRVNLANAIEREREHQLHHERLRQINSTPRKLPSRGNPQRVSQLFWKLKREALRSSKYCFDRSDVWLMRTSGREAAILSENTRIVFRLNGILQDVDLGAPSNHPHTRSRSQGGSSASPRRRVSTMTCSQLDSLTFTTSSDR